MKSPSVALIWELGRKNRWGLALLLVPLGVSLLMTRHALALKAEADHLTASLPLLVGGSLRPTELAHPTPPPRPRFVAMTDTRMMMRYGLLKATPAPATNAVTATVPGSQQLPATPAPQPPPAPLKVQFTFAAQTLYAGPFAPADLLAWSGVPGRPGTVRFTLHRTNLFEGPLAPEAKLAWTTAAGDHGQIPIRLSAEASPELLNLGDDAQRWHDATVGTSVLGLACSFVVLCAIFGCAEPDRTRGFSGIPPRRFALPVSTLTLIGWPMLLGATTVLALCGVWLEFVFRPLLPRQELVPSAYLALLLIGGLAVFQALVWTLPAFPKLRACLITLLMFGLVGGASFGFEISYHPALGQSAVEGEAIAIFAGLTLAAIVAAWLGVGYERRGGWASQRRWEIASCLPLLWQRSSGEFTSALQAQYWIEWRRNGRLPLVFGLAAVVVVFAVPAASAFGGDKWSALPNLLAPLMFLALPVWIAITGLNLARDGVSRRLALSSFTATRPVATGTLLTAKILVAARLGFGLLAFFLVCGAVTVAIGAVHPLTEQACLTGLVFLAASLHLFAGILPVCLSGRLPGFPWSAVPLVLIYSTLVNAAAWLSEHPRRYAATFGLLVLLLGVKLILGYWGFRRSLYLGLIARRFVVVYTLLWLLATGLLVALVMPLVRWADWGTPPLLFLPAALLVLPLARIAVSPLALSWNRHR